MSPAAFDMTEADVQKNLELVAMCGLPPFVDEMIDILFVDEGIVFVGVPRLFTKLPLRLTAPEGFALLASARAAIELRTDPPGRSVTGFGETRRRCWTKPASGTDDITAGVVFDLDRPPLTDELAEYTATGAELLIDHYSPDRDAVPNARSCPSRVRRVGRWSVAWPKTGRSLERRTSASTGSNRPCRSGKTCADGGLCGRLRPGSSSTPTSRGAVLRLAPEARSITKEHPVDDVVEFGAAQHGAIGWVEVRLPVASERW